MSQPEPVLMNGNLLGKLPGMKDWNMYFVEMTPTQLHILDAQGRKQVRTLEIDFSDIAGEDTKNKKEFRFYLLRQTDGRYTFRCETPSDRTAWITELQRVIKQQSESLEVDSPTMLSPTHTSPGNSGSGFKLPGSRKTALGMPLPAAPSPRASVISTDSGFGASEGGEVRRERGFKSAPSSGDGKFSRRVQTDKNSVFERPTVTCDDTSEMNYEKCKWYWGTVTRQEAEQRLLAEGKKGNFIVRVNANGYYVMTYWRKDGLHHHKILHHGNIYRFERSAVEAEGESLVDLLDTYMKANSSTAKPMEPFGGALYDMYNYAWTPPEIDMNVLQERMKEQKRLREDARASQRKQQYTPVDIPQDSSGSSREGSGSGAVSEGREGKSATLPAGKRSSAGKAPAEETTIKAGKKKPLPTPPAKKPLGGAALIQEMKSKTLKSDRTDSKPNPRPKPTPAAKPGKAVEHEPPAYANTGFMLNQQKPASPEPVEDENVYMNIQAPKPPPSRKPRGQTAESAQPSQYQNFASKPRRKH